MSILKKIHEAVDESRKALDFTASEDSGDLRIAGSMSVAALEAWQQVFDEECPWLTAECVDSSNDKIAPKEALMGERVRLIIKHSCPDDAPHLFTLEGWRTLLHDDSRVCSAVVVRLAFIIEKFSTEAFEVEPWINPADAGISKSKEVGVSPRRQVRCQSPEYMAPSAIEPWILRKATTSNGVAFLVWQEIACGMIARALPNELYMDVSARRVGLFGQPPRQLDFGKFDNATMPFAMLQEAGRWVYLEGTDVEVRHTFLSNELAREWNPDTSFCDGLSIRLRSALDSARLLYKAHLRSGSKDTLRALADLRKTLADEVQKLLQQSRDLSNSTWRDVAIAVGAMAIRFAMDNAKAGTASAGFFWIYIIVAIYIAISYAIISATNFRFLKIVDNSRFVWRSKLYAFLDDADYKELAERPLSDALEAYRRTQFQTSLVVSVIVFILLLLAADEAKWISIASALAATITFSREVIGF